jgi:hypothetical protein
LLFEYIKFRVYTNFDKQLYSHHKLKKRLGRSFESVLYSLGIINLKSLIETMSAWRFYSKKIKLILGLSFLKLNAFISGIHKMTISTYRSSELLVLNGMDAENR